MGSFNDYEIFKSKFYSLSDIDLSLYKEKQMKRRITSLEINMVIIHTVHSWKK